MSKNYGSKGEFVRHLVKENGKVTLAEFEEAWKKEHPSESVPHNTTFYTVRKKMGKGAKRRQFVRKQDVVVTKTNVEEKVSSYETLESQLDKMIQKATKLRNFRLAEQFRVARRQIAKQLV